MTDHHLKSWPQHFQSVKKGEKPFELRNNDRDFHDGDGLILEEWNPDTQQYTGETYTVVANRVFHDLPGLLPGHVAMSLRPCIER